MKSNSLTKGETTKRDTFTFNYINYILMGIGVIVLGIGYILLTGGGSEDPNVFNEAMFDNRRLVAAPIMIVLGIIIEICAIMIRFQKRKEAKESTIDLTKKI